LNKLAMVAADTTRSKYYLTELIRNKFFPTYVLLLLNLDAKLLPGQDSGESERELVDLLNNAGIEYQISPNSDINSNEVLTIISNRVELVFIFSGFGGVLLGDNILSSGKKFLHIHGGYLPDYKGSTTNYYSLINENTIGASSMFLSKEIDCGPVLLRRKFSPPKNRTEIDHIYDSEARAKVLIETLEYYVESGSFNFELENNQGGETFYIIHPVLKHLSILKEGVE
jgi:methionyl-tRNA formyltransferase